MKISVTLITSNRKKDIINTISNYYKQSYDNFEIILVDNGSKDGTKEAIKELFPNIKYLYLSENYEMKAMNIAFSMAEGDIFWRGDDDSYPESTDCFKQIVDIFTKHPQVHIIASEDIEMRNGAKIWHWYGYEVDKINIPSDGYHSTRFAGTGVGFRREVWEKTGGFWGWGYEELDWSIRAMNLGFNIRYFPNVRTLHFSAEESRRTAWRWLRFYLKHVEFVWKYMPFFTALNKTTYITINQVAMGLYQRIPIKAIIEGFFSVLPLAMQTRRENFIKLRPEVLDIAKKSVSFNSYLQFYKHTFKAKLDKRKIK